MKVLKPTLVALALLIPSAALAQVTLGQNLGTTEAAIRASMTEAGYTVTDIDFDSDEIEIEAVRNGQKYDIELTLQGVVKEMQLDD